MNTLNVLKKSSLPVLLLAIIVLIGCKKETEQIQIEALTDYLPLQAGKYITYRTDSTVFTNFGTITKVRSYQEKQEVDALVTDNLGRPSYRIFRYLRDTAGSQPWTPAGSLYVTLTSNTIEVIENNLRYVKLASPIGLNNSWKGNRFLPIEPYQDTYEFSNDDDGDTDVSLPMWNYTYTEVDGTFDYKGQSVGPVVTVLHISDSVNAPVTNPDAYGYVNYSTDKYAKGIGLVYEELTMWEYQPNTGNSAGYKTGFGVKRTMIDHN